MNHKRYFLGNFAVMLWALALSATAFGQTSQARTAVTPGAKQTVVPFELFRGHIYVDAFVNQRGPFRFVVDTGASGIGRADVRLVKELNLATAGIVANSDAINTGTMSTVSLNSLSLGQLTRNNVVVGSRDYNAGAPPGTTPIMGFIGREFFADHLWTIDYAKRELVISTDSLKESEPHVVRYETAFRVPFRIGQHEALGWLDTGSFMGIVLTMEWAKKLGVQPERQVGRFRTANTISKLLMPESPLPLEVEIAGNKLSAGNAVFAEFGDRINIGGNFLEANRCALSIDQKNQLLRLRCAAR